MCLSTENRGLFSPVRKFFQDGGGANAKAASMWIFENPRHEICLQGKLAWR
jgi:hypothetical protein